jgi:hypothetical protein
MLWPHHHLLIPLCICVCLVCYDFCPAQSGQSAAPWRLESSGPADLLLDEPFDVNNVNLRSLLLIPGITPDLAQAILIYRGQVGFIESLDELRELSDVNDDIYGRLRQYLKVTHDIEKYSIKYLGRYRKDVPVSNPVTQSPFRFSQKVSIENLSGVLVGVAVDKDPGEGELWDHASLVFEAPLPPVSGKLILGDYVAGFGQGLVIRTRRNYGLGSHPQNNLPGYPKDLKAYYGWDESIALRGAAISMAIKSLAISAWGSSRYRDARINETGQITSFDLSGLHRSDTEQSHRDACREEAAGIHAAWRWPKANMIIGTTLSSVSWNLPYLHDDDPVTETTAAGIDLKYSRRRLTAKAECGWDSWGHAAQMMDLHLKSDLFHTALALYHADPDYFAPLASSLDFELGKISNREGIYSHFKAFLWKGYLSGFMHLYRFPERLPGESWGGQDYSLLGVVRATRSLETSLSSRWVQEEDAETHEQTSRWRSAAFIKFYPVETWRLKPQLRITRTPNVAKTGYLLSLSTQKRWRAIPDWVVETGVGFGYYSAEDYSQRLYWIDYDVSNCIRVKPLWGKGVFLEITATLSRLVWGSVHLKAFWDQPYSLSDRSASRTFTANFKYPA